MKKYFICFFLLLTCSFLNCFSTESVPNDYSATSIQKVVNNKVYLKPGQVQIAKNGIFITHEGELLAVSHLESDSEGVYFEPERMKVESCETCGLPLLWGKCVNPKCPSKKKKD